MEILNSQLSIIKNLIESKEFFRAYEESLKLNRYDVKLRSILEAISCFNFGETLVNIDKFIYENKSLLDYYNEVTPEKYLFMSINKFKKQLGLSKIKVVKNVKSKIIFCQTDISDCYAVQQDIDPKFEMAFLIIDGNFADAKLVNLNIQLENENDTVENYWEDINNETYEDYNGSHAQDYEGFSDQFIDDVFDGDPDMYWNID
jgi:hypothetical protein